ncbi:MAG: sulfurtransferase TusA family protein [Deltaproteobacteria bacterium]|nr:sulfurtransferase TusA family protein [Deltaproteobacteria bacterium]
MEIKEIDMRGQICPSTFITALREINLNKNEIKSETFKLVFITDNRDSTVTIPETAENMGYGTTVTKIEQHYRIEIFAARQ